MMSLPLLSQTLSSDSTIVVPKQAVKNALIMKGNLDTCSVVLQITQEKVVLLEEKANKQNQLILNLNQVITNKDGVIVEKDNIIKLVGNVTIQSPTRVLSGHELIADIDNNKRILNSANDESLVEALLDNNANN